MVAVNKSTPNPFSRSYWTLYQDKNGKTVTPEGYTNNWTDTRNGFTNPDYRRQIARHENATTTLQGRKYNYVKRTGIYTCMYWYSTSGNITNSRYGSFDSFDFIVNPTTIPIQAANNLALQRYIKRALDAQQQFAGGVALGELAESLRMIRNPAKTLRRGIDEYLENAKKRIRARRSVPRGSDSRRSRIRRGNEILADTWLEHSFGWAPLISDIRTGAEALAKGRPEFSQEFADIRAGAKGNETSDLSSPPVRIAVATRNIYGYRWLIHSYADVRFYGQVRRKVVNDLAVDMERFGFTPNQFVPTVWELIPYSFLVDYFTNIGEIINAWSYHKSSIAWLSRTVKQRVFYATVDRYHDVAAGRANVTSTGGKWLGSESVHPFTSVEAIETNRAVYQGSLVPSFEFQIPGMGLKWINMSALATSHFLAKSSVRKSLRI